MGVLVGVGGCGHWGLLGGGGACVYMFGTSKAYVFLAVWSTTPPHPRHRQYKAA